MKISEEKESKVNPSSVLVTHEGRGRIVQCSEGHGRSKSKQRSQSRPKSDSYWPYGMKGHTKKNCWFRKKNQNKDQNEESMNIDTEGANDALILSVDSSMESWILDSRASFHSTLRKECMLNYITKNFGKVYLADDEPLDIVRKGDVHIKMPNESMWKLKNVKHISGLKRNSISIG